MDGKRLLGLIAEHVQIVSLECDWIGAVDPVFDKRYLKYEYICTPTARRLGVIAEYEGAACGSPKVGGNSDLPIIGLAQQGQYDIDLSIHYSRHIALLICAIHSII